MTVDAVSQERLVGLHPLLARKAVEFCVGCEAAGIQVRITQGLRTFAQQAVLYQQGRSSPGPIVTHAPAGYSWHNYGLAFDFVPMVDQEPCWNDSSLWDRAIAIGEGLGLTSGSRWPEPLTDRPHFQLTGNLPAEPDDAIKQVMIESGVSAVWSQAGLSIQ